MDRAAWWATVHGTAKSQTWLSNWAYTVDDLGTPPKKKKIHEYQKPQNVTSFGDRVFTDIIKSLKMRLHPGFRVSCKSKEWHPYRKRRSAIAWGLSLKKYCVDFNVLTWKDICEHIVGHNKIGLQAYWYLIIYPKDRSLQGCLPKCYA